MGFFFRSYIISSGLFYLFSFPGMANQKIILEFSLPPFFLHLAFCYALREISTLAFNFLVHSPPPPPKLFIIHNFQGPFSELLVPLLFLMTCCSYFMHVVIECLSEDIAGVSF